MTVARTTQQYIEAAVTAEIVKARTTQQYIEAAVTAEIVKAGITQQYIEVATLLIPIVETPVIDPVSGEYTSDQTITITCGTPSSTIYYTTDGSDPDNTDTEYTVPISVFRGTLKTIAYATGFMPSEISTEVYTMGIEYRIEYGRVSTGLTDTTDVGASLDYTQLNLEPGVDYRARVQAYVGTIDSAWTDWVVVKTLGGIQPIIFIIT